MGPLATRPAGWAAGNPDEEQQRGTYLFIYFPSGVRYSGGPRQESLLVQGTASQRRRRSSRITKAYLPRTLARRSSRRTEESSSTESGRPPRWPLVPVGWDAAGLADVLADVLPGVILYLFRLGFLLDFVHGASLVLSEPVRRCRGTRRIPGLFRGPGAACRE